jgi:hypothetical protein
MNLNDRFPQNDHLTKYYISFSIIEYFDEIILKWANGNKTQYKSRKLDIKA